MMQVKLEVVADTEKGKTNLGTWTYQCEVDGKELKIIQRVDAILAKDKQLGFYGLGNIVIETKGKDFDL